MKPNLLSYLRSKLRRPRLCLLFFALCGALLCRMPLAAQCNYTVTTLADSGTGSLRAGLADSTATDICFGVSGTISLSSTLQIFTPVTITGSTSVIIDGNNQVEVFLVEESAATDVVRINGLTLTHGNASAGNYIAGGALQVLQGNVTLVGTIITANTAESGGGIDNQATLTLSQCAITNNTATNGFGGGIENAAGASLTLQGSTITGNLDSNSQGGGLDNSGTVTITGGIFSGNQANVGAAIMNDSGGSTTASVGTLFSSNTGGLFGGAIHNDGSLSITQALFTGNSTTQPVGESAPCGGAICNYGTATVTESTFTANTTNGSGGAIENTYYASLELEHDTIVANTASVSGSGLFTESYSVPTINNTIIAENTAIAGDATSDCDGCMATSGLANLIGVTVNLGPLATNGGPTQSMMPLPGSPAIDAGDPAAQEVIDPTDQRGFSRLNSGNGMDIGAVQTHYSSVSFLAQPSNSLPNQTITPPVAVQVVEVDNSTTNYPQGVPVNVSLQDAKGVQVTGALTGTLTHSPTVTSGVTSAVFPNLAVNTAGTYKLFATTAISGTSTSTDLTYSATSSTFQIAVPVISWTPAAFVYGPLPATVLNATATLFGSPATGTFVYTFVGSGAPIVVGQIYPAATYPVQVALTPTGSTTAYSLPATLLINQATPVLSWATPAAIFTSTTLSATQLDATAVGIAGAALPGTFVYKPAAGVTLAAGSQVLTTTFTPTDAVDYTTASAQVTIQVNYPPADVTVTVPSTTASGEQPGVTIVLNSPYPSDLAGALALTFAPKSANGVDDPAVQFSTGGRTSSFTVTAGSTTIPPIALQTGTVAGTITVTLALTTGGVDVTPPGVSPITLVIAPGAPVITSVKFTNDTAGLITVVINGFSNTREMTQATFVFTGSDAQSLGSAQVQIPVASLFSPWYSSTTSDQYGSEFTYTQNFQLSKPDSNITGASATLANSIGTSGSVNSQ
jgi:hypothetical protein